MSAVLQAASESYEIGSNQNMLLRVAGKKSFEHFNLFLEF
jgi:hypothetical protein